MTREDVGFEVDGVWIAAWLYRPEGATGCVVMAHGWSGVREQRLDAYAERFADAGLAALVFDYRHFGASHGEPRQLLDIRRQLADWRAAVAYARALDGIERVALWGSSFSGGHVIETAAADPDIAAVVSQVPFVDGLANLPRLGIGPMLKVTGAGLRDQLRAMFGRAPHMLAAVGPPGSTAVMTTPDAEAGFLALNPPDSTWRNETAARIALRVGRYRPARKAARITCPIFFAIADDDAITPPDLAEKAASRAPRAEVRHYHGGHFDVYVGELFERAAADETEFLVHHLAPVAQAAPSAS